jgi:hypothetical protein
MKKQSIIEILNMFFGKTPKKRFKRVITLLLVIVISIVITLNLTCSIDSQGNWKIEFFPAADVDVNINKGGQ